MLLSVSIDWMAANWLDGRQRSAKNQKCFVYVSLSLNIFRTLFYFFKYFSVSWLTTCEGCCTNKNSKNPFQHLNWFQIIIRSHHKFYPSEIYNNWIASTAAMEGKTLWLDVNWWVGEWLRITNYNSITISSNHIREKKSYIILPSSAAVTIIVIHRCCRRRRRWKES